jgi:hypothetical protein
MQTTIELHFFSLLDFNLVDDVDDESIGSCPDDKIRTPRSPQTAQIDEAVPR